MPGPPGTEVGESKYLVDEVGISDGPGMAD
jgi:hypothetical protein